MAYHEKWANARLAPALFCAALAVSWVVMLRYAWSAFSTLPSAERLETSRMAHIPTLGVFGWLAVRSAIELVAMVALAWPARRRHATRLAVAAVVLPAWFIGTAPLTLTVVEWVHRRWLAGVWLALVLALGSTLVFRLAQRLRDRFRNSADS